MEANPILSPLTPDSLAYKGTAVAAFDELATKTTYSELLDAIHTVPHSKYNKETAHLFTLMGGDGYTAGTPKVHVINTWPLMEAVLGRVDAVRSANRNIRNNDEESRDEKGGSGLLFCDYSDWSKKHDSTARQTVEGACRDTLQWMGTWLGQKFDDMPDATLYVAFSTIADDICIPPLDLLSQRFRVYGRSARELMQALDAQGWGRDATMCLLSLVRQYLFQYAEKVDHGRAERVSIHDTLGKAAGIWDSTVFRMHTANTVGVLIAVARVSGMTARLTDTWIHDSAICDAISGDLCKSAMRIYTQDNHMPTATAAAATQTNGDTNGHANGHTNGCANSHTNGNANGYTNGHANGYTNGKAGINAKASAERQRRVGYHSLYLDLIDDLVNTGAPEPVVHFGRSGFLFVQVNHRYLERASGNRRFAIHPQMAAQLRRTYGSGAPPADSLLSGLCRLRYLVAPPPPSASDRNRVELPEVLLNACRLRQLQRQAAYDASFGHNEPSAVNGDGGVVTNGNKAPNDIGSWSVVHGSANGSDEAMAAQVHAMAQHARSPEDLLLLLSAVDASDTRVGTVSADDAWALCVACQVDCGGLACEWLAYARYIACS